MSQIKTDDQAAQAGLCDQIDSTQLRTVKSYLYKIVETRLDMEKLLAVDDPVLEGLLHSGNPAYRDPRYEYLKERLPYFEEELDKVGVTRKLLWEEYLACYPEVEIMVSQNVIPSRQHLGGALPYAFTEHGVLMLCNVLKSDLATKMSIKIHAEIYLSRSRWTNANYGRNWRSMEIHRKLLSPN